LIAIGRSVGKICRDEGWVISGNDEGGVSDEEEGSRADAGENKSGVDDRVPISDHAVVRIGRNISAMY